MASDLSKYEVYGPQIAQFVLSACLLALCCFYEISRRLAARRGGLTGGDELSDLGETELAEAVKLNDDFLEDDLSDREL